MPDTLPTTIENGTFTIQGNNEGPQTANETFKLTANDGHALGSRQQTIGFAKYQVMDSVTYKELVNKMDLADSLGKEARKSEAFQRWNAAKMDLDGARAQINDLEKRLATAPNESVKNGLTNELNKARTRLLENEQGWQQTLNELADHTDVIRANELQDEFKAAATLVSKAKGIASVSGQLFSHQSEDPKVGGDRGLLTRAVASTQVDRLLKLNVITEEKFAADGRGKPMGVSVQTDGSPINGTHEGKSSFLDVNYRDPEIQKGLSDLEVADYITGQIDRHAGNIYIDPSTKKVTGIDNDLAFPEIDREQVLLDSPDQREKAVLGMPSVIHADTAKKIASVQPSEFRKMLEEMPVPEGVGKLSPDAIDQAVKRLENLQQAIKNPKLGVKVVKEFNDKTFNEAVNRQEEAFKVKSKGKSLGEGGQSQLPFLKDTHKTSYLGTVALEKRAAEIRMGLNPEQQGFRPANTAPKATRDYALSSYASLKEQAKAGLKANPKALVKNEETAKQITKLNDEVTDLQKKVDALQKKVDSKSLFSGFNRKSNQQELTKLQGQLDVKQKELDQLVDKELEPHLETMRNASKPQVKPEQPSPKELQLDDSDLVNKVDDEEIEVKENTLDPNEVTMEDEEKTLDLQEKDIVELKENTLDVSSSTPQVKAPQKKVLETKEIKMDGDRKLHPHVSDVLGWTKDHHGDGHTQETHLDVDPNNQKTSQKNGTNRVKDLISFHENQGGGGHHTGHGNHG